MANVRPWIVVQNLCHECKEWNPRWDDSHTRLQTLLGRGLEQRSANVNSASHDGEEQGPMVIRSTRCSWCRTWIGKPHFQLQLLHGQLAGPSYPRSFKMEPSVWGNLPQECLDAVLARLPLGSRIRFSKVCMGWHSKLASPGFKRLCDSVESRPVCSLQYQLQLGELVPFEPPVQRPYKTGELEVLELGLSFLPPKFQSFGAREFLVKDGLVCIVKLDKPKIERPQVQTQALPTSVSITYYSCGLGNAHGDEDEDEEDEEDEEEEDEEEEEVRQWNRDEEEDDDSDAEEERHWNQDWEEDEDDADTDEDDEDERDEEEDEKDEEEDDDDEEEEEEDEEEEEEEEDPEPQDGERVDEPRRFTAQNLHKTSGDYDDESKMAVGMSFCVANPITKTFKVLPPQFGMEVEFEAYPESCRFQLEVEEGGHFSVIILCVQRGLQTVSIYRSKYDSWKATALCEPLWFDVNVGKTDWPQYFLCSADDQLCEAKWPHRMKIHCLESGRVIWDGKSQGADEDMDTVARAIYKFFAWRGRIWRLQQDNQQLNLVNFGIWELESNPYMWRKVSVLPEHLHNVLFDSQMYQRSVRNRRIRLDGATLLGDTMYFSVAADLLLDFDWECMHLVGYNLLHNTWSQISKCESEYIWNKYSCHLFRPNGFGV